MNDAVKGDDVFGGDAMRVPCCMCENDGANNILMLHRRGVSPGHGWGCVACGLPSDGAVAVLCNECVEIYQENPAALRFVCHGYVADKRRVSIDDLPPGEFDHDRTKHPEID